LYSCNLPISRKASCSPSASRSLAKKTASQMHNCTPLVKALKVSKLWFNSIDRFVLFDLPRVRHCLFAGPNNNYWLYNAINQKSSSGGFNMNHMKTCLQQKHTATTYLLSNISSKSRRR
jgi:hypothetical protein